MKPGGGKTKGGNFERDICKRLTKWATGKESPVVFWRSASSGAQATQANKRGGSSTMHGDIMCVDPTSPAALFTNIFSIECKTYKHFKLDDLLWSNKAVVNEWWEQSVNDALLSYKLPLLIFKKNQSPTYIMFNSSLPVGIINFGKLYVCPRLIIYSKKNLYAPRIMMVLEDFLNALNLEDFKKEKR